MRRIKNRTTFGIIALAALLLFVPDIAHGFFKLGDIYFSALGKIVLFLGQLYSFFAGIAIMIISWVLSLILALTVDIVNSPVVQAGFPIVLAVANLGFVLGIIIIAIATILRKETYGVKQILWKLIVMAVLVNFGLVIGGSIIATADGLTMFFVNKISPTADSDGVINKGAAMLGFADKMARAFQPQRFTLIETINTENVGGIKMDSFVAGQVSNVGAYVSQAAGLFLGAFAMTAVVIVLAVFAVMLLVRYIALAFLLVVLPLAWLMWVFPGTQQHYHKWWSKFISQTVFAPVVVFFVWLMLVTAEAMQANTEFGKKFQVATATGEETVFAAILRIFGGLFEGVLGNILQSLVLIGILMAGMIAAQSFSASFANVAGNAVDGMRKWGTGALGRGALRGGRAAYRGAGLEKLGENLSTSKNPFASALGRKMATLTTTSGKNLVSRAEKEFSNTDSKQISRALEGYMTNDQRIGALSVLQKRGDLSEVKTIEGMSLTEFRDKREGAFKDYGQGKLMSDIDKATLSNKEMRDAAKANNEDELRSATQKFAESLNRSDIAKADVGKIWSGEAQFGLSEDETGMLAGALSGALATNASHLIPSIVTRLNSNGLRQYNKNHERATATELARIETMPEEEKLDASAALGRGMEVYEKAIANNAFGFTPDGGNASDKKEDAPPAPPEKPKK